MAKAINKVLPASTLLTSMSARHVKVIGTASYPRREADGFWLEDRCNASLKVGPFSSDEEAMAWRTEAIKLSSTLLKEYKGRSAGQKRFFAANRAWL